MIVETIRVRNRGRVAAGTALEIESTSHVQSIFNVRGHPRGRRGRLAAPEWSGSELLFEYEGADGQVRTTRIRFTPEPEHRELGVAGWQLRLLPGQKAVNRLETKIEERCGDKRRSPSFRHPGGSLPPARIETDNPVFDAVLARSLDDLRLLTMGTPRLAYVSAGL